MNKVISLLIICVLTACAPIRVDYDYEPNTDFSKYKTYNYYGDLQTGMNEFDDKRMVNALNTVLKSKGLLISNEPDFYIDINTGEFQDTQGNNQVGVGVGGNGRNIGGGVSVGIPIGQSKIFREITVEFRDEDGKGLFWQAVSESSYNPNAKPQDREKHFMDIAEKILSHYPPSK